LDNGGCQTAPYNGGLLTWTGLIPGDYAISELDPGTIWAVEVVTPSVNVPAGGLAHGDVINITDQESPPTAVDLVRWTTLGGSGSVAHSWATAGENGTQAFRLYRSAAANRGTATLVTEVGATGTANAGSSYAYLDAGLAAGTYYYWLVEVSGDGSEAQIAGPREVVVGSAIQRVTTRVFIPISIGG
jgi:hypothetical protein